MKVLLINPSLFQGIKFPGVFKTMLSVHDFAPPLGLMYLKSYLTAVSDAEVKIFNFQVKNPPCDHNFIEYLKNYRPNVIGITVMTNCWYDVCKKIQIIKKIVPSALIVGGGAHMNIYAEESLHVGGFDVVVQGEGEVTFAEIISQFKCNNDFTGIKGTSFKLQDKIIKNPPRPVNRELNNLPIPDYSDYDIMNYRYVATKYHPSAVISTSRGCPHQCSFCANFDVTLRTRNVRNVVDEMVVRKDMGFQSINFFDNNLCESKQHITALCEEIIRRDLKMPWMCMSRVDCVDKQILNLMSESGCELINFGVESANQHILDRIQKKISVEQSRTALKLAKEAGIATLAYFIVGFPFETTEEMEKTLSLAFELSPDYVYCSPLIPAPGTKLYQEAVNDEKYGGDYYKTFVLNPTPNFYVKIWETTASEEQILKLIKHFYIKFYFRPRQIIKSFKRLNNFEDFWTKTRMAKRIFFTSTDYR